MSGAIYVGTGCIHATICDVQHGPRDLLDSAATLIRSATAVAVALGIVLEADGEEWGDDGTQPRKIGGAGFASVHGVAAADGVQTLLTLAEKCVADARSLIPPSAGEVAAVAAAKKRQRGDA